VVCLRRMEAVSEEVEMVSLGRIEAVSRGDKIRN
jgi:hypothetical protein